MIASSARRPQIVRKPHYEVLLWDDRNWDYSDRGEPAETLADVARIMRSPADIVLFVYGDDSRRDLTDKELAELREELCNEQ
jgi:hypothetical protein